jgi:putative methyltransferase (TIGR04325 family)
MDSHATKFEVGEIVQAPYFFSAEPEVVGKPQRDDPFSTEGWLDHCRQLARRVGIHHGEQLADPSTRPWRLALRTALEMLRSPLIARRLLTGGSACPQYLLPVAAMIHDVYLRRKRVTVLDVGGGFGDNFFELLRVLKRDVIGALEYRVLDNERSCALGRDLYASYRVKPTFFTDYQVPPKGNDIVLLVGTLQYIADWHTAIPSIAAVAARYLYVARTPIAAGDSFTAMQLVCPSYGRMAGRRLGATPVKVANMRELRAAIPGGWTSMFEFMDLDYSTQFARLPPSHRNVAYVNLGWQRVDHC